MPSLTFEINHAYYRYDSKLDEDSFRMGANAKSIETWHLKYFSVFKDGIQWDGLNSSAHITFTQRDNRKDRVGISVDEPFNADYTDRDMISVSIVENSVYFDIILFIPFESFERVKSTNWSIEKMQLIVDNGVFGQPRFPRGSGALIYGPDPDGYEIEWHVDRQTYQFIEYSQIIFLPKSNKNEKISEVIKIFKDSKDELSHLVESKLLEAIDISKYRSLTNDEIISRYSKIIIFFMGIISAILIFK